MTEDIYSQPPQTQGLYPTPAIPTHDSPTPAAHDLLAATDALFAPPQPDPNQPPPAPNYQPHVPNRPLSEVIGDAKNMVDGWMHDLQQRKDIPMKDRREFTTSATGFFNLLLKNASQIDTLDQLTRVQSATLAALNKLPEEQRLLIIEDIQKIMEEGSGL